MDLPKPPADTDLRNIIDKLAQFVARNGPEFEHMTKTKQKNNPKFQFLYGGEYFNYYQYKVTTEQAILKQQGILSKNKSQTQNNVTQNMSSSSNSIAISPWTGATVSIPGPVTPSPGPVTGGGMLTVEQITQQQNTLQEQIQQSEQNLSAQYNVLMQQQQAQIDDTVCRAEADALERLAKDTEVDLEALDQLLRPIMDSCTKDSISNGKGWILQHGTTPDKCQAIAGRLLKKVNHETTTFLQKLHVIYLVNDVLHHCARKHADDLKKALEDVVVPMFCNANIGVTNEQKNKLDKLLSLWESKANYFTTETVEKLHNPVESYQEYQASLIAKHATPIATLTQNTKNTFDGYQVQHNAFVAHAAQQIQVLEQQKQTVIEKQQQQQQQNTFQPPANFQQSNQMPLTFTQPPPAASQYNQQTMTQQQQSSFMSDDTGNSNQSNLSNSSPVHHQSSQQPSQQTSDTSQIDYNTSSNPPAPLITSTPTTNNMDNSNFNQNTLNIPGANPVNPNIPPLTSINPNVVLQNLPMAEIPPVTFSQPPPRFFDAPPAGIFPDFSKPPPGFPVPPAFAPPPVVEEIFPSIPYYDLPAGLMVPLLKLEDSSYKPLNPGAIRLPPPAPPSERLLAAVEAFYGPPSHERPRDSDGWEKLGLYEYYKAKNSAKKMKDDAIAAGLRPKSKSPSPIVIKRHEKEDSKRRRYSSKSPSPRSPIRRRSGSRSRRERSSRRSRRSRSRSRTRSPPPRRERSISPPPMMFMANNVRNEDKLDESNKGHQLLKKMGWGGSGLGAKGQGIEAPISGGEIRDRQDMYKGVGISLNDPYESFRKHKGAAFITRMKERAEERAAGERC